MYTLFCYHCNSWFLFQGINPEHEEFYDASGNSRVGTAYSFDTTEYDDCNGHGTHITGTMAGLNYGLAKDATIHSGDTEEQSAEEHTNMSIIAIIIADHSCSCSCGQFWHVS